MNTVHVLDCTLRDGGYCNEWKFGFRNTQKITAGLVEANIDVVECGFISNRINYDKNITKFKTVDQIAQIIPKKHDGKIFVAMMNYGEYDPEDLPQCDGSSIDGIRVAFHKKNMNEALEICYKIKERGYKVFIQPMVSLLYTDEEFLNLIHKVNDLEPYAFYIVDSFGMMKGKDLTRLYYVVEHNLKKDIWIGFHSHNNMQLAFSNAQTLVGVCTNRNLIIDSSVYGMGRGAGNLNTELFIGYLNENYEKHYKLKPLLIIIDEILNEFYQKSYWGYSLPNYISAVHNAHPNYAGFLDDKKTLTVENMNDIFDMMDAEKKASFDRQYIEQLYRTYMATGKELILHGEELKDFLYDKKILLIAPGKSAFDEKDAIIQFVSDESVVPISINYDYPYVDTRFIFLSNLRRFRELELRKREKCIVTSNIPAEGIYLQTKYKNLLAENEAVEDNAGMMAIKFFSQFEVSGIYLAGFDGYTHDARENYGDESMAITTRDDVLDAINVGMYETIKKYAKLAPLFFLTKPRYVKVE